MKREEEGRDDDEFRWTAKLRGGKGMRVDAEGRRVCVR